MNNNYEENVLKGLEEAKKEVELAINDKNEQVESLEQSELTKHQNNPFERVRVNTNNNSGYGEVLMIMEIISLAILVSLITFVVLKGLS